MGHIDHDGAMKYCADSEDIYQSILRTYLTENEKNQVRVLQNYKDKDWKSLAINIHAVKSNSKTIGAFSFSKIAEELEADVKVLRDLSPQELARSGGPDELFQTRFDNFMCKYREVLQEAQGLMKEEEAKPMEKISQSDYVRECRALHNEIENYELQDALDRIDKLKHYYYEEESNEWREVLAKIQMLVDELEYERANEILDEWILKM